MESLMHLMQRLRHLYNERQALLWVTPAINSVLAVLLALAAAWLPRLFPGLQLPDIERATLTALLTVIASSMLAVTTFSLSIMVAAFAAAANGASPRATELLMGDEGTRTAIAAFLSAFIFAVVAQIALGLGYYGSNGRFVLFIGTLLMLIYLIVTLVRWVRTLSLLGRFSNTLARIEAAATAACQAHALAPWLGAARGAALPPAGAPVLARQVGYVRRIDMAALQGMAHTAGVQIHLRVRPGRLVGPGELLAVVSPAAGATADTSCPACDVAAAVLIADNRSFEQDPRFGLIVLSEVGQRAMSAAINDPGSGIAAINAMTRVLLAMAPATEPAAPAYPSLTMVGLDEAALVHDGFEPIARDGAGNLEMAIRLQKLLAMIACRHPQPVLAQAAREQADRAAARHLAALVHAPDRQAFASARQQAWDNSPLPHH
jgi:uncharacterized membrane protein